MQVDALSARVYGEMNQRLEDSKTYQTQKSDWLASNWKGMLPPNVIAEAQDTGVAEETLKKVGAALTTLPETFTPHRMVGKIYQARNDTITYAPHTRHTHAAYYTPGGTTRRRLFCPRRSAGRGMMTQHTRLVVRRDRKVA